MKPRVLLEIAVGSALFVGSSLAFADDTATDERAVKAANDLLIEVGRAYAKVPAMTDEMTMTFAAADMDEQKAVSKMAFEGKSVEVKAIATMLDLTVVNDTLYAQMQGAEGAIRTKLGDKPYDATKKALGTLAVYMPPQIAMRWNPDIKDVPGLFGFGFIKTPKVAGLAMIDGLDGARLHEVLLKGEGDGLVKIHIDPKTKFIQLVNATGTMEGMDSTVTFKVAFKPKMVARLETPITFDESLVKDYHESIDALMASAGGDMGDINPSIEVGSAAPKFELTDQHGKVHTLDAYAGKIILMDWWGIW